MEVIVRQESGLNPLAVNIVGQSYYPVTREEADQTIWRVIVVGQRFGAGKTQIDNWWMERLASRRFNSPNGDFR